MAIMADCVGFQAQIASIIEMLANSAVVEICKLVEDGYAALRSQMDQERGKSEKENDALRQKLRDMDTKMRNYERKIRRRNHRDEMHNVQFRPPEALSTDGPEPEDHMTCDVPPPVVSEDKLLHLSQEDVHEFPPVKKETVEKADCNLDLKVEVNIRAECGLSSALQAPEEASPGDGPLDTPGGCTSQSGSPPPGDTMDLTCRPRGKRKPTRPAAASCQGAGGGGGGGGIPVGESSADAAMKPEVQPCNDLEEGEEEEGGEEDQRPKQAVPAGVADEPGPERLGGLGLDLTWMQERVSHLGAAFAVAQLGLGNTEAGGHHSSSFLSPAGGGDSLDGPPTMVFPGAAHEMAAFAASFDMAAAAAAAAGTAPPPPPAPVAPSSATSPNQRHPYRSVGAKEPMVCGVCGRAFPSTAALALHQRVHTGERPYSCPHCGKGFAQPNNLRVHLLIHSGERRYRCSLCGKSFISSSHLKRHRTVHTQEKPYTCARCGQSFSQMCSVRRHRQQSQCGL